MNREKLIQLGLIIPASFYQGLAKDDPRRIEWEYRLIRSGTDPRPEYRPVNKELH